MKHRLDDLDKQILEYLYEDVRMSNRKIASALGITEGTVRSRIRRMQENRLVRFTAALDTKVYAQPVVGFIGITVDVPHLRNVSLALAEFSELNFVATVLGRYDIICTFLVADNEQLRNLLQQKIPTIAGVKSSESVQDLRGFKFDRRWSVLKGIDESGPHKSQN